MGGWQGLSLRQRNALNCLNFESTIKCQGLATVVSKLVLLPILLYFFMAAILHSCSQRA